MRPRTLIAAVVLVMLLAALSAGRSARAAGSLVGALYVTTTPSEAAVYVNGELKGISPCGIPNVAVGDVEVKAVKQGYRAATQTATVEGDKTSSVELALARLANVGSIAVLVEPPGAAVEVDRVPAGISPTVVLNVPAGTHRVVVSARGFRPLYTTVTVVRDQQFDLRGRLERTGPAASALSVLDLDSLGVLDEENLPSPQDLPDERAFEGVRTLVASRQYDAALGELDAMAAGPSAQRHALRIGQERRFIRRLQELTAAAYEQLEHAEGQDYVLRLRKGVRLTGRLSEVADDHAKIAIGGVEREIPLESIAAEQIVRLAQHGLEPDEPEDRVTFALLHAAEGEFDEAYNHLRAAARGGCEITAARTHVDAEHLWTAAVQKEAADLLRARTAGLDPRPSVSRSSEPVPLLIDTHRGRRPPEALADLLAQGGFAVRTLDRPFAAEDGREPAVLLIVDAGVGRPVPAFDRQEVQSIVDLVQRGGGLAFFGAARPPAARRAGGAQPEGHPYAPLLGWFGIAVRADRLSVDDEAPNGYPGQWALAYPSLPHAVTHRVRQAVFPIASPSLAAEDASWVLMRAPPFVRSRQASEAAPALVAGRTFGRGRVLVFANLPHPNRSAWEGSPLSANNAESLVADGLAWVSAPARLRGVGAP